MYQYSSVSIDPGILLLKYSEIKLSVSNTILFMTVTSIWVIKWNFMTCFLVSGSVAAY